MNIVTAEEMYDVDHYTMKEIGLDGKVLMENAGRAVSEKVKQVIRKEDRVTIVIGPGNNGGDGFVIARTLMEDGYRVQAVQLVPDKKIGGDASYHKQIFLNCGGDVFLLKENDEFDIILSQTDVLVDCILGIGVYGPLRSPIKEYVRKINEANVMIISVDIPSGLPSDEGLTDFESVQADYTFTIGAPKLSAFLQTTAIFYGKWETVSIGFPKKVLSQFSKRELWSEQLFKETMPKRNPFSYKGNHGRGLIVGGSLVMPGSITMTVQAALKAGAGLITAATVKENIPIITSNCPEAMSIPLSDVNGFLVNDTSISTSNYDAIAIGIGMGRKEGTTNLVRTIMQANCPLIIDADGLYHLKSSLSIVKKRQAPTIITPHAGEMAMLLDVSIKELLLSPFQYSLDFAREYGVYVVLKGKFTIITSPDGRQIVNTTGNQGLAKGGSGDVLTGIILAMVLQHDDLLQSLCNACYVHGKAADLQIEEKNTYYDLMATDVISGIPNVYRTLF
ncbi:bifunctional ADP-dependent NAD(P)H-hydrate dehydratase/NAD(P)H-hydrate epimerase [Oceanobacillus caeni]|uniref:bifunctional ADP-dependent NAD(P)H-hydrate dehydratase/NAD(P)H-hydrate epimerase n=1 Tax=Oceanobacillus TaxID=182709 RepID=UPI0006225F03|nr:bifunctional ADP-dependent NAD(P)H-hydrate dehydratase/NAD(P)H-hydrate epimerase [Oceanobacillus caeni]KKE80738.1 hypothetical protein WH51_00440 [Bacilli bacterium VT-13-104]PZD83184.1 bifunctional ADP-dependent NAD(P)H-hydrate dehydratase/NAD(P)H-hydrate epimerase [Bacilli bacterium]MBU8792220.1 bifunctional ADP-dependent NAD(P)H-hydrate dehydratase/NAD(P)H-hydrate epimerase [Oceanobacillus caeni]MCR1835663.1 bifunctional ADP-dependent NAD(P)H-hydrate dehydratase/NAD(P)H-hydrate epimerase 